MFRSLYSLQGTGQVMAFLKYWRSPCQAGQLLRHATAWAQYGVGTSVSFLTDVTTVLPHMECKWLASLRSYLCTVSATIELDKEYVPRIERINDQHIMDLILQSNRFTPKEIRLLNYCRMYLQAVTISDIATATGTELDIMMRNGIRSHSSSKTKWHHFNQKRPSVKVWKLWKQANRLWSHDNGQLIKPLHQWLQETRFHRRLWHAYHDASNTLYISVHRQSPHEFQIYRPTPTTSTEYIYYSTADQANISSLPVDTYPISAQDCRHGTWRINKTKTNQLHRLNYMCELCRVGT
jgi:hypothetical protein